MLKVVELFAGIGAQASALDRLGIDYTSTVAEIDKHAYKAYCAIHGDTPNLGDITKVKHLPECDLLTYSFPCQDLSIAGCMQGMDKESGTKSSLIWEVGRLIDDAVKRGNPPKMLVMENVTMVHSKKNMKAWTEWLTKLGEWGYSSQWADLSATDFNIPQTRKRCFLVSLYGGPVFSFPEGKKTELRARHFLDEKVPDRFYLSKKALRGYESHKERHKGDGLEWRPQHGERFARTVTTNPTRHQSNYYIESGEITPESIENGTVCVRRFTPRECWRLMGFTDEEFDKAESTGISNTQLYKQAGNTIVVPILEAIFKKMLCPGDIQASLISFCGSGEDKQKEE